MESLRHGDLPLWCMQWQAYGNLSLTDVRNSIILVFPKNNPRGVGGEGEPPATAAARRGEERRGKERKGFGELLQHRPRQRIPGRIGGARHLKGIFWNLSSLDLSNPIEKTSNKFENKQKKGRIMIQPLFFRSFRVVSDFFLRRFEKQIEQNENNRKKIEQIRTDNTKTKGRIMIQPFLFG